MHILVLNAGSSSIKFQLIDTDGDAIAAMSDRRLARGQIDRIGGEAVIRVDAAGREPTRSAVQIHDYADAVEYIINWLTGGKRADRPLRNLAPIEAVGHRVVHGGGRFTEAARIDDAVWRELRELVELAPLHNANSLRGISAARAVLGADVPQVAVFDTAFHHTLPETAYVYAIPYEYFRRYGIRRYGFHGTSHRYLAYRYRQLTGVARESTRIITLHLGNGASACAIVDGKSVDTSMGFTPLEGLVMGTRSGDLDPAILDFVSAREGMTSGDVDTMLNEQSGLLGLSGLTSNMRELLEKEAECDDHRARLAIDVFCYRVKKYLGAYLAAINGADAIVFAGGIGENSPSIRERICTGLNWLGISIDAARNAALAGGEGRIDRDGSRVKIWVIPTDEELLIARDTVRVVTGAPARF